MQILELSGNIGEPAVINIPERLIGSIHIPVQIEIRNEVLLESAIVKSNQIT